MTIEELLASSAIDDKVEVSLGNEKVTVGALRAYATAAKAASDAAARDAETRRRTADEEINKAKRLAEDSLKLYEEAERVRREGRPAEPKPGDIDWENDPVYRPVHQRFQKELADLNVSAVREDIKRLQAALAAGFKFVTDDYQDRRWSALPADVRPKDKTWRDYMKMAEEQNIRDAHQLFDPVEAFNRSTAEERRAADLKAAERRGEERAERKAREASALPRPGSTPVPMARPAGEPKFKNLTEALNAAAQDPEILRIAAGTDAA
jgi:hypothetical protein